MTDGPYSRLYHRFAQEFPDIYKDDRAFAAWARLLMLADASWPMRPPLPRSVRPSIVRQLTTAGVLILDGDDYTVLGLDAERTRRRDSGRIGAGKRWGNANADANGHANADAKALLVRDETRRDEITPPPQAGRREDGTNPRALGTNPRATGTSVRQSRAAEKRSAMPESVASMLRRAAEEGRPS